MEKYWKKRNELRTRPDQDIYTKLPSYNYMVFLRPFTWDIEKFIEEELSEKEEKN